MVDVVERVPEELLTFRGEVAAGFYAGLSTLRAAVRAWQAGHQHAYVTRVLGFPELHPVTLVRRALADCPDEAPVPGTLALSFIGDVELRESIRLDIRAANRDLSNGNWKGATVLAGSAIEALLLWALQDHETANPGLV